MGMERITDMNEAVYRLGSGSWRQNLVGFGVGRAAETLRFQLNNELLTTDGSCGGCCYSQCFSSAYGYTRISRHE